MARWDHGRITLYNGDCLDVLRTLPAASVDSVVTDPPYPEIDRDYGRMTETDWLDMMKSVVAECRRVLRTKGSAVFVLQPNFERVGRMRTWLWDFMAWAGREHGIVQDAYWWNHATLPSAGCQERYGLMRPSVKACVWVGSADCYRDQSAVLWSESLANIARRAEARNVRIVKPNGISINAANACSAAVSRGGVTPFNLLPVANTDSAASAGAHGHQAGTPWFLADWWIRYITPDGGTTLDPFCGSGTMPAVAKSQGLSAIGIEKMAKYFEVAKRRVSEADGMELFTREASNG